MIASVLPLLLLVATSAAHTIITYPGWRGNNLHSNGTYDNLTIVPGSRGINWDADAQEYTYPYGMQWMYPCGGMPTSKNRTKWPVDGGALAVQPGWFSGHQTAFFFVNIGIGSEPPNMSHPVVPAFQIVGPNNEAYGGSICLPQVPMPANLTFSVGDHITIQIVELAVHGAALYNCVDVELADPEDVEPVTADNCYNSTGDQEMGFNLVFTSTDLSAAPSLVVHSSVLTAIPFAIIFLFTAVWL